MDTDCGKVSSGAIWFGPLGRTKATELMHHECVPADLVLELRCTTVCPASNCNLDKMAATNQTERGENEAGTEMCYRVCAHEMTALSITVSCAKLQ